MPDSFGARVRQQRERRGTTLAEIADHTKIKVSLLEALERDDVSQWPAGIFRRAYVRAYASAIGLEPDAAVREFLEIHPEPAQPAAEPQRHGLRGLFAPLLGSPRHSTDKPSGSVLGIGANAPADDTSTSASAPTPAPAVKVTPGDHHAAPAGPAAAATPPASNPDLAAAAAICTALGRVDASGQLPPLLGAAADALGASGLIVWVWDEAAGQLRPAFVHGYPSKVRAQLRGVGADEDNITAAAFRAAAPQAVAGGGDRRGALALPLLVPSGCAGVLAMELPAASTDDAAVRALAAIFAAMLAQLIGAAAPQSQSGPAPGALESQAG